MKKVSDKLTPPKTASKPIALPLLKASPRSVRRRMIEQSIEDLLLQDPEPNQQLLRLRTLSRIQHLSDDYDIEERIVNMQSALQLFEALRSAPIPLLESLLDTADVRLKQVVEQMLTYRSEKSDSCRSKLYSMRCGTEKAENDSHRSKDSREFEIQVLETHWNMFAEDRHRSLPVSSDVMPPRGTPHLPPASSSPVLRSKQFMSAGSQHIPMMTVTSPDDSTHSAVLVAGSDSPLTRPIVDDRRNSANLDENYSVADRKGSIASKTSVGSAGSQRSTSRASATSPSELHPLPQAPAFPASPVHSTEYEATSTTRPWRSRIARRRRGAHSARWGRAGMPANAYGHHVWGETDLEWQPSGLPSLRDADDAHDLMKVWGWLD